MSTLTDEEKQIILDAMSCMQALNQLGWLENINKRLCDQNKMTHERNQILGDILEELIKIKERLI